MSLFCPVNVLSTVLYKNLLIYQKNLVFSVEYPRSSWCTTWGNWVPFWIDCDPLFFVWQLKRELPFQKILYFIKKRHFKIFLNIHLTFLFKPIGKSFQRTKKHFYVTILTFLLLIRYKPAFSSRRTGEGMSKQSLWPGFMNFSCSPSN